MVIALMVGWFVAGLLLALFVGAAVRIAEARGAWRLPVAPLAGDVPCAGDVTRV
ncbi:hypothetical protein TEK04_15850 [Klenkia sp. LSe6-5]|uniref:Uncharacterized protein n=1 Tax=Klenkia sesuvii TaxID=3103137 RepID=A0ABU8DWH9_9ACTN